jgi:ABC-type transport system involved in multi-copper enzyme maturation permease subunit
MIWLTWRQFRSGAAMMAGTLAVFTAMVALTGSGLAGDYATGIAACTDQRGGCSEFSQQFFHDHQVTFLAVTAVVLVLPALIGLFWGAPLIARELEAGTHRLVWNQSVTRTRWLAVKLGLIGLAAMAAAGLGSLAVGWWYGPVDAAAAGYLPLMAPPMFDARGIVPIGYAAFAFALGVTVGMLVRGTLPAMALTLAVFVAVQIAMPLLVRPNLVSPAHATVEVGFSNLRGINRSPATGAVNMTLRAPDTSAGTGTLASAWILSSKTVDASGHAMDSIPVTGVEACAVPSPSGPSACIAEINRLGYRQQVTYQPSSRYWAFQAYETAIFIGLALLLAGFCFRWLRHRVS